MSDLEKILSEKKEEISQETGMLEESLRVEIPRDAFKRPWSSPVDFIETPKTTKTEINQGPRVTETPWYTTSEGVAQFLGRNKSRVLGFGLSFFAAFATAVSFIPSMYYSTTHIYVPAKINSMSTRLHKQLDNVDFVSLPVDIEVPTLVMSKELEDDSAKQWVIEHLAVPVAHSDKIRAEAGYALQTETLVVQGYGPTPEIAAHVTDLYRQYFAEKLRQIQAGQLEKINRWADLRIEKLQADIEEIRNHLTSTSTYSANEKKVVDVRERLSGKTADLIMKQIGLQTSRQELMSASNSENLQNVILKSFPQIQDQLEVYHQLSSELQSKTGDPMHEYYGDQRSALEKKIRTAISEQLIVVNKEISDLEKEIRNTQVEVRHYGSQESDVKLAGEQADDFFQKILQLKKQREDVLKLKHQIELDYAVPSTDLKVIREPKPDEATRRPNLIFKYTSALLAALMMTVICVLIADRRRRQRPV